MGLAKIVRVFYLEGLLYPICLVIALAYKYFILVILKYRYENNIVTTAGDPYMCNVHIRIIFALCVSMRPSIARKI